MRSSKKNVLFIPAWYPSRVDKLAGIFTERHAIVVRDLVNVSVLYVCADDNMSTQFHFEKVVENDIPVLRVFFKKGKRRNLIFKVSYVIRYTIAMVLGYLKARKYFGKPDMHHVHVLTRGAVLPLILYWTQKIPYVITEHWSRYLPEDDSYGGYLRRKVTEVAVFYSKGVSCVSRYLEQNMKRHGLDHENYHFISNVVDTELFKPVYAKSKSSLPCFLHVSSFDIKSKNVKGIIDAAIMASEEGKSFKLHLVGDGPERLFLEEYVNSSQINNAEIVFFGELSGNSLIEQYNLADAFILFSYYENQPCVVLESFSCGVPVIGSEAGGIPELVSSDYGILVEAKDVNALKNAMLKFINHEVAFDCSLLRSRAVENFSNKAVAMQFKLFYSSVF